MVQLISVTEVITTSGLRVGQPIPLGGVESAYPARAFGRQLEEIGYAATSAAFGEVYEDEAIRHLFNPDDPEKIARRVSMIESLGRAGFCWAVPAYQPGETTPDRLLGFGLLKSNKSNNRIINFAAETLLRRPAVAEVAVMHVHPDYRELGIGTLLLRRLAVRAHDQKLLTKPSITIVDGYETATKFFRFYGFEKREDVPEVVLPDYFGPGKPATAHTYEARKWTQVLIDVHERGKLPEGEQKERD